MEAAMWKRLAAICFGLLLILAAGTAPARSGDATFKLTNKANFSILVKVFSQSRNWQWPTTTTHWTLGDDGQHEFHVGCQDGEKICYGGAFAANDKTHWGVGFKGDKPCQGCCLTCGSHVSHAWNLTSAPSNTREASRFLATLSQGLSPYRGITLSTGW